MNILVAEADLKHTALKSRPAALFANKLDVRKELHCHGNGAVALAGLAAAAGNVERKVACAVAAALGVGCFREDFADSVEGFEVRGGIRARRAADGRLVHDDHVADLRVSFNAHAELLDAAAGAFGG